MASTTIQAVYDEARTALESGKDERAIGLSEHLLESFPHYLEAYRLLGESHLNRQELDQAATAFERVLRADPENIPVHVGLGVTYERQGNLAAAIREFEQAFEIKPDLPELRSQVLRLYTEAWGSDNAHLRLKKAGLARLYVRSQRYDKAIQEFQDVLSQEPERRDVAVALAEAYWRNDQEAQAADLCRSILADDPDVLKANLILGYILLAAGDPQGKTLWSHAQQLDPSQGVALALFDGMMPPVEPLNTSLPTFDEQVWRNNRAEKERQAQEAVARAEQERRDQEEREHDLAVAAPVAAGSWLDEVESTPITRKPAAANAGMDDDFLKALLLGTAPPAPVQAAPEPTAEDLDFSLDDLGLDVTPFSLEGIETTAASRAPTTPNPAITQPIPSEPSPTAPFDFDMGFDLVESDLPETANNEDDNFGLSADIQPFSFDDWDGEDLDDLPTMDGNANDGRNRLQPFSLDSFDDVDSGANVGASNDDDLTLPANLQPFSLDELDLDTMDDAPPSTLSSPFGRDLPIYPEPETEPKGFSWQEPRSRSRSIFGNQPAPAAEPEGPSIFDKLVVKKQTQGLLPLTPSLDTSDLDDETLAFFSHDDVPLRDDDDLVDPSPIQPTAIQTNDDPDLTPFSLTDFGLSDAEIAQFNTVETAPVAIDVVDDEPNMTPFSLADLGLSDEEIAALNATDEPATTSDEPNMTPFSLADLGLSDEEIAALNATDEPVTTSDEPNMTPFSLADLGLSDEEIAALNGSDSQNATIATDDEDMGFMPFSLSDLDLDEPQLVATTNLAPSNDELKPFSLAELGLSADEIASFDGQEPQNNDAIFNSLFALGEQQGFVDLTDIINCYDDPEAHAEEIDRLALELHQNNIQIRDGDEIIDMDELADEVEAEYKLTVADEPDMTPFSLADLGLSDEEIAAFNIPDEPTPTTATSDEPNMTPFSLADLGLSDEEIAALNVTDEPTPATSDEPNMTPFSLADLGLSDEEIAAFNIPDEPTPTTATSDEPNMTPFSLADLGLSDEEIAAFNIPDEPTPTTATSDEPNMTPFSLADLGLSDEEIAALNATDEPNELDLDPDLTPFSLAELGLTEEDLASLGGVSVDERSLGLSAQELDDLDLSLPSSNVLTIEPGPVWQEAQEAVDEAVAAERAEHQPNDEPDMTPFSLADLGLSDAEIAEFDALPTPTVPSEITPTPPLPQPERSAPATPEPAAQETKTPRPLYDVSPRPAPRPRYEVSPRPTPAVAQPSVPPTARAQATLDSASRAPTQPVQAAPPAVPVQAVAPPMGDLPDLTVYQEQLAAEPSNHGLRLAIARMMGQTSQVEAALGEYKRLIKQGELLDPIVEDIQDLIEASDEATVLQRLHRALGDAYSKQGRWREAMEEYSWVLTKPRR